MSARRKKPAEPEHCNATKADSPAVMASIECLSHYQTHHATHAVCAWQNKGVCDGEGAPCEILVLTCIDPELIKAIMDMVGAREPPRPPAPSIVPQC